MRHNPLFFAPTLALGLCMIGGTSPALAQPDTTTAPKAENPPNWNQGGRARIRDGADLRRYVPLTPEKIRQMRAQQVEEKSLTLKARLAGAGFTDEALQTTVANEYKAQEAVRDDLQDKWYRIATGLRVQQVQAAQIELLTKEFRDGVEKEKTRRAAAVAALEAQFKISQKPLLDALLMTMGITGDESGFVNQISADRFNPLSFPNVAPLANGNGIANATPRIFRTPNAANAKGIFRFNLRPPAERKNVPLLQPATPPLWPR